MELFRYIIYISFSILSKKKHIILNQKTEEKLHLITTKNAEENYIFENFRKGEKKFFDKS